MTDSADKQLDVETTVDTGRIGRLSATLRLFPEVDPDEVTRQLGCEPTKAYRVGDPISKRSTEIRTFNLWLLRSRLPEKAGFDAQISDILERVTQDLSVWKSLRSCAPEMLFGVFLTGPNQGDTISTATLGLLADRGIQLQFDIYVDFDDEA